MAQVTLQGATPGGVVAGIILVVFGFSGFESSTSLGDGGRRTSANDSTEGSVVFCFVPAWKTRMLSSLFPGHRLHVRWLLGLVGVDLAFRAIAPLAGF